MEIRFDSEVQYRLLKLLQEHPDWSQRQFAGSIGVSLGKINYCVRALLERGFVKLGRFSRSEKKTSYRYLLTSRGIAEKARTTACFLERKEREFEVIQREIRMLKRELEELVADDTT